MTTPTYPLSWYFSFVDPELSAPYDEQVPGGPGFLGACIVTGNYTVKQALDVSQVLGLNPGGQAMAVPVPTDAVPPHHRNRFIPRDALPAFETEAEAYVDATEVTDDMRAAFTNALVKYALG